MTVRIQGFNPILNYVVGGTSTSSAVVIAQPLNNSPTGYGNSAGYTNVQFYNPGNFTAFASWSMGTATATASTNALIPATGYIRYEMGYPATSIAVILGSATTGNIYIAVGDGQ